MLFITSSALLSTSHPRASAIRQTMSQVYGALYAILWKSDSASMRSGEQARMSAVCAGERELIAVESERKTFECAFCTSR